MKTYSFFYEFNFSREHNISVHASFFLLFGEKMKKKTYSIIIFLMLTIFISGLVFPFTVTARKNVKVLALITTGFGESYYINKDIMESFGWEFYTAGTAPSVLACTNRPLEPATSDYIISQITDSEILDFDCVFIPSGGHWLSLCQYQAATDLVETAYYNGSIVSAICTGIAVLAEAGDVLNGTEVVCHPNVSAYVTDAGGILKYVSVYSHKRVVTGGAGGGPGIGASGAPNEEFCELLKEVVEENITQTHILAKIISPIAGLIIVTSGLVFFKFRKPEKRKSKPSSKNIQ